MARRTSFGRLADGQDIVDRLQDMETPWMLFPAAAVLAAYTAVQQVMWTTMGDWSVVGSLGGQLTE